MGFETVLICVLVHLILYWQGTFIFRKYFYINRVPTRTGKPGKMGRHFPVREKSGNFEQTGKVRENHTKYWKTETNWDKYYLTFLVTFKWTVQHLPKWIKFSVKKTKHQKNTGKMEKNTGKVREFCQSRKVGTLINCLIFKTESRELFNDELLSHNVPWQRRGQELVKDWKTWLVKLAASFIVHAKTTGGHWFMFSIFQQNTETALHFPCFPIRNDLMNVTLISL